MRRRKLWGWGYEDERADPRALAFAEAALSALLGGPAGAPIVPPTAETIPLSGSRVPTSTPLEPLLERSPHERLVHATGRSYRDIARAVRGDFPHVPDAVALPRSEQDLVLLCEVASKHAIALVPFGGGTSVAGGVEPAVGARFSATLSVDLRELSGLRELDETSLAACFGAGTLGPDLEAALRPRGLTLRHYPQSFELSTLGGWIATRAGGHFATVYTHIDDLVESVSVVTPAGTLQTRRLPGSGAGPAPERLLLGSEGALGFITSAWVRLFERPRHRATASVSFTSFEAGLDALRRVVQSGLCPANCRLIDGAEAIMSGAGTGEASLLLLAFESAHHPQDELLSQAIGVAREAGGALAEGAVKTTTGGRDATADTYKASFFRAPYLRDELILRGVFVETYETAAPWSRLPELDLAVRRAVDALELGPHLLARRVTHAYRDGCAPYYTLIARARERDEDAMWREVKAAITDAIVQAGGTSTHHHAIGRDVVRWHEQETSPLFRDALRAVKATLDPAGVMNPGALLREP